MQKAGVNLVSLAIFSWSKLEPRPGEYRFEWLDRVIDLLHAHGVYVNLATATASPPPWFSRKYPDSLPVNEMGIRYNPGSRQHYCPNSRPYKEAVQALAAKIANRYHRHPGVVMWHINNEYACHNGACYCQTCTVIFRQWLQARYETIDALNEAWGTDFWSQTYSEWDEITLPNRTISFYNPAHKLDYRRFMNDSLFSLYRTEIEAVQQSGATQLITTNFLRPIPRSITG
jgi:beta-galactosidase